MKVFAELFSKSDRVLFTCLPLRSQLQQQQSYRPWGTRAECVSDIEKAIQSCAEENQESQKNLFFTSKDEIFKYVFRDMLGMITDRLIRKFLQRIAGIGNGKAEAGFLDHGGIVVAVANRDHVCNINAELFREGSERFALARLG